MMRTLMNEMYLATELSNVNMKCSSLSSEHIKMAVLLHYCMKIVDWPIPIEVYMLKSHVESV